MDSGVAQARACEQAFGLFPKRHDLQGRLLIMAGDAWRNSGKKDDALRCYQQAITLDMTATDNVLLGCDRAERILAAANRADVIVAMYRNLYVKTPTTLDIALSLRQQTLWYQLGLRYAAALDSVGRSRDAANVRTQINAGNTAGPSRGG
jgi:tetratricopeptide (TPR) repeat protein